MTDTLGRYKILGVLGQGAMGVVYKAVDPVIDRTVAIKTINLAINPDELAEYEARFQQEIKAAGKLNHPSIVTIYDVGKTESVAYMAMELLDGKELKDILATDGVPPVSDVIDWIAQIAGALATAHEAGIIHRDVKPSNIMIVKGGLAKITDFGIARMTASAVKTMTGLILGSPRYMSPEQVIGRGIDHRSDVFSLGVVLYEALAGTPPFDGDNVNAIMYATVNHAQQPASSRNPQVPPMLDLIAAKALAKAVDERYQSMREFAADLNELKRQFASAKPKASMLAENVPSAPKGVSFAALGLDAPEAASPTDAAANAPAAAKTLAMTRTGKTDETTMSPLALNNEFDSFAATMKLASLTTPESEHDGFESDTKKLLALNALVEERKQRQANTKAAPAAIDEETRLRREARRAARDKERGKERGDGKSSARGTVKPIDPKRSTKSSAAGSRGLLYGVVALAAIAICLAAILLLR